MAERGGRGRTRRLWPLLAIPGIVWLALLLVAPVYVVLAILFGGVDPILRQPVPVWNPFYWDVAQFEYVWQHVVGSDAFFRPALVRTVLYVGVSSLLCLVIAYRWRTTPPGSPAAGRACCSPP